VDAKTLASLKACVDHARDLIRAARAVQAASSPNIAYHLAALALEELGRRELIAVQSIAEKRDVPPAWPLKHAQSHTQKLFWAFFGGSFTNEKITKESLEEMRTFADHIHSKRLGGLYVNVGELGPEIPSEKIKEEEATSLIDLAAARLAMEESAKYREHIPAEELETQAWFLKAADDPETRKALFSSKSMDKLAELKDARAWAQWLRSEFEKAEVEGRAALQKELARKRPTKGSDKKKWKLRIRINSDSHSIRPKVLNKWNETVDWIKLTPVPERKNQLLIDFILLENIPLQGLWYFGWGLARHFVTAMNIGSMGFFWWKLPQQISRYYEHIDDLETKSRVVVERSPILKVDWGANRVLSDADLGVIASVFAAMPAPRDRSAHRPYNYYIGGLTFLALNDIHWQCESTAFGNFAKSLQEMMRSRGHWKRGDDFVERFTTFIEVMFPEMDEKAHYVSLVEAFAKNRVKGLKITLKEASFMKLFCDAYFLKEIRPLALEQRRGAKTTATEASEILGTASPPQK
jgi:AbiV family abortive infection protein